MRAKKMGKRENRKNGKGRENRSRAGKRLGRPNPWPAHFNGLGQAIGVKLAQLDPTR